MSSWNAEAEREARETRPAVRLRKPERRQLRMAVECLEDLVGAEHPVRMVAAVVAKLDLARFGEPIQARQGVAGRDATDPELLVALWLYACIRGIGSARELARRCEESAPFRWLCGGVSVNHAAWAANACTTSLHQSTGLTRRQTIAILGRAGH